MSEYPPAVVAAADQAAAAYREAIVTFPKVQTTFGGTVDPAVYEQVMRYIPHQVSLIGGSLDGLWVTVLPGAEAPETLAVQVGPVTHWYRRVVCDWWTCYEWVRDHERP